MAGFSIVLVGFSLFTIGVFLLLAFCITAVIGYVLLAISLTCLAQNNGYGKYAVLAWIPILNFALIGLLCGEVKFLNLVKVRGTIFSVLSIVSFLTLSIMLLFLDLNFFTIELIMLCMFFMSYLHISYGLLRKINKSFAAGMTFLAAVCPIITIVYVFIKRNVIFEETYIVE